MDNLLSRSKSFVFMPFMQYRLFILLISYRVFNLDFCEDIFMSNYQLNTQKSYNLHYVIYNIALLFLLKT